MSVLKRSFLKDLMSIGVSKILIIIFGLLTSIITARYIGPEGNGVIAAILVYPSLFMSFGSLGISQSVTYFLGQGKIQEDSIKRAIIQIWIFSTVFSLIICYILITFYTNAGGSKMLVLFAVLPIPFTLFNIYSSGIYLGNNNIKEYNRINWIPTLIVFISNLVCVIIFDLGVLGALISLSLGPFVMSVVLLFKNNFLRSFSLLIDWDVIRPMLTLGLTYAFSLLIINLNYKMDVIFLDKLSTPSELGYYYKGASLSEYLWQIPMLFSTLVFARSAAAKDPRVFSMKVAQLLRLSFITVGVISVFLTFTARYIIEFMYGKAFYGSISVLKILLPGVLILTIYKVMNMDLAGKGKPWLSMKAMIPSLIINAILNYLLIPQYGANGSAFASTISYAFGGFLFLHFYSKETHISIREIIKFKKSDFLFLKKIILR